MADKQEIRNRPCPECYLCGSNGRPLYQDLRDRLFDTPGEWSLKECLNPECGLVWLDPMPLEEEIGKAYQRYYTHHKGGSDRQENRSTQFLRWNLKWIYSVIKNLTLIRYKRKIHNLMYMHKTRPGRLLEIGCGDGRRLSRLRGMGWEVEGQEIDPKAATHARDMYDLTVHLGVLQDLAFKDDSFEAIIMNHVIEHVFAPVSLLAECHRILKPNGILVAVTPNIMSYGHKVFGPYWRGLEPPRHLHLFSQKTLRQMALKAGFNKFETWTSAVKEEVFATGSLDIKHEGRHRMGMPSKLNIYVMGIFLQLLVAAIHPFKQDSGGECVLKVIK